MIKSIFSSIVLRGSLLLARCPQALLRFLSVGLIGLFVDQSILKISEYAGLIYPEARALAIFIATVVTFYLNRKYTFSDSGLAIHHEALRYFAVAIAAQSVNYVVSIGIVWHWPLMPHFLAALFGTVVATFFSYSGQRFFTFANANPSKSLPSKALK